MFTTIVISSMSAIISAVIASVIMRMYFVQVASSESLYCAVMMVPVGPLSAPGEWSTVSAARIIAPIDVAAEMIMAMIPRAATYKYAVLKPLRSIVSVRGALVRLVIVVAVRTRRFLTNLNADANLSIRFRSEAQKAESHNSRSCEIPESIHGLSSLARSLVLFRHLLERLQLHEMYSAAEWMSLKGCLDGVDSLTRVNRRVTHEDFFSE
jgi:hypothetical protein